MNKSGRRLVFAATVVVLLIIAGVVNVFFYPFTSAKPNFSDVERVFNKIVVPADWVEISSSENRGIAGRACPIEPGSACFHSSKVYAGTGEVTVEAVKTALLDSGCPSVADSDNSYQDESKKRTNFECSIEGLLIYGELIVESGKSQILVGVST